MGNADSSDSFGVVEAVKADALQQIQATPSHTKDREVEKVAADTEKSDATDPDAQYPDAYIRWLTIFALGIGAFLVGLDINIVGTAIPTITNQFHSANSIGWYTSANLLAASASQLYYGKLYSIFSSKYVLITAVVIFEIGSITSGAAPSSVVFTIGRAISGLGRAGLFAGAFNIMKETLPLHQRPLGGILIGGVEVLAVISAPVLGGALTTKVSWRWCFFLNPILSIVVLVVVIFLVPKHDAESAGTNDGKVTLMQRLWTDFDHLGAFLIAASAISLLLALQWGGIDYPWSSVQVALPLGLSGALLLAFFGIEYKRGTKAVLPLSLLRSRTVLMGALFSLSLNAAEIVAETYLAIWFQMVKHASALHSGLMLLPTIIGTLVGVTVSGIGTSKFGHYVPFMLVCSACTVIATGLFQTFTVHSNDGMWIGYQLLLGIGIGCGLQQPFVAAQTYTGDRNGKTVGTAIAVVMFLQTMGGTMSASIAQNVFLNQLATTLPRIDPNLTPAIVRNTGLTELVQGHSEQAQAMLVAVNHAVTSVFAISLAFACLSLPAAVLMPWKSVKKQQKEEEKKEEEKEEGEEKKKKQKDEKQDEKKDEARSSTNESSSNEVSEPAEAEQPAKSEEQAVISVAAVDDGQSS